MIESECEDLPSSHSFEKIPVKFKGSNPNLKFETASKAEEPQIVLPVQTVDVKVKYSIVNAHLNKLADSAARKESSKKEAEAK